MLMKETISIITFRLTGCHINLKNFSGGGKQEKARQKKEAKERQSGSSVCSAFRIG